MAKTPTEIKSFARSHTELALRTLAGIARQKNAPHSARVAASIALLDRGWGKPEQSVDLKGDMTNYIVRMPEMAKDLSSWTDQHMTGTAPVQPIDKTTH